jgi:D-xylose transport system substrate-binding protein
MSQAVRRSIGLRLSAATAAAALCLSLASCAKKEEAPQPEKKVTIGFSLDSLIVERWLRDRDVFVATANSLGAEVIFQNAANGEKEQVAQVKYLIDRGVDVLVIVPQNAELFTEVIQKAKAKGIKVISYDRLIRNAGVDLYVSVNSFEVGQIMARAIIREVPAGNYVFINGPKSDYNVTFVQEGQRSVFVQYPGVYRVLEYYADNWSYDLAYDEVTRILESGTKIDAIVCGNDGLAGGAIRALSENRLAGKVPVVGQDADIAACQYVADGTQLITIYKPISDLARDAARFAVAMARREFVPPSETINDGVHNVPVFWLHPVEVNRDNLEKVIVESGFHSAEDIYRNIPAGKRPKT